jgi:hypothetical protein
MIAEMYDCVRLGGFGTSVTPVSQFYAQQAIQNVMFGKFKKFAPGYAKMVLGYFGKTPVPPDPEIVKKASEFMASSDLNKAYSQPTTKTVLEMNDADPKKGGAVAKKMLEDAGLPVTDENIFIAASCKEKGILFLKDPSKAPMGCRFAEEAKPAAGKGGPVTVTINGKAYGVEIKGDGKAVVNGKEVAFKAESGLKSAAPASAAAAPAGGQDVIVVYEESLVDMRVPVKIPLPYGGTIWSIDFPTYVAQAYPPSPMAVEVGGIQAAMCVPVVNVQALAYRDLKDRIHGIATPNVTRAAVKIAAQQVANHVNTGNAYANLALRLGVLLYNVTSTAVSEADTRAWQTVPEHVQLARLALPPGKDRLTVRNARTGMACEVAVPHDGGTKIVWISDAFGFASATVLTVGANSAPTWTKISSLLVR